MDNLQVISVLCLFSSAINLLILHLYWTERSLNKELLITLEIATVNCVQLLKVTDELHHKMETRLHWGNQSPVNKTPVNVPNLKSVPKKDGDK